MIHDFIRKFLGTDKTEAKVDKIKNDTMKKSQETVSLIHTTNKKIYKTQTYYFGRALGVIKNV